MKQIRTLVILMLAIVFIGFAASEAKATHFRYGNVSSRPILDINGNPTGNVEFKIRESWRRSYATQFLGITPVVGSVVNMGNGFNFGNGPAVAYDLTVTSFSATEDWFVGERTLTRAYATAGPFTAFMTNCCRISNLNNGADGNFRYETLVRPFSLNSSPTTSLPPIINLGVSATSSFTVVGSDIDGDTLRYRLATFAESGIAQPAGLSINSVTGVVSWNTIGKNMTNFWSTQIIIEDLDGSGNVKSKTPVDVLIRLVNIVGTPPQCLINGSAATLNLSVTAGTPVSFTVTGTDADIDPGTGIANTPLTLNVAGLPIGATMNPTLLVTAPSPVSSLFNWTPTAANGGSNSITFSCTDNTGQQALRSASIFVVTNQAPLAVADSYSTNEDTPLNVPASGVLSNDTDADNDTLTAALVSGPSNASSFTLNPNGSFSYTPNANFNGSDSFTYRANDGQANSNTVTVSITVNAVNDAPTLSGVPSSPTIPELAAYVFTASASDIDLPANTLTFSLVGTPPAGASIDPTTGQFSWTPTELQGNGSSYGFTVRVSDGTSNTDLPISITVTEVNSAPTLAAIGNQTLDELTLLSVLAVGSDVDDPANTLVYSLDTAPAGMTINSATGAISWTPAEDQGPGDHPVTVRVTDDGTPVLFGTASFSVHVNEVNSAPVLGAISNQTGYWGNAFVFTATATDPDIPANALTFSLSGAPAGAAINPSSGGFSWNPAPGQVGMHTFTVLVTDNGVPVLNDTQSVTITVGKRPTVLVYTGDYIEQYSDQQALKATLTDNGGGAMQGLPLSGKLVGFAIGTQNASDSTDASGASTDLILTQNPNPTYTVDSSFAGDASYLSSSDTDVFDITKEDARAYYTGTLFVSTSCATCSTGTATLSATIKDITAETGDPAYDAYEGDIRNSTVTFINRDTNTVIAANVPVGLVDPSDLKTGTAVFNWNVNIGSNDSLDYTVGIIVNHYYTRNSSEDNVVVTVSKPIGTNFITGGGYLVLEDSNGQYAGLDGKKSNFGFNVKYNNSGTNLKGRVNVIIRGSGGRVYQIKGNVMRTLSVMTVSANPLVKTAVFTGKANLTDITDPLYPIVLGGNNTLQMAMTDFGEPGNTDTMGISLLSDAGGVLFSSNWNGIRTIEQILGGGNLVVR